MSDFVTKEAVDAATEAHLSTMPPGHVERDPDAARHILEAAAPHIARAALLDFERSFRASAEKANLSPLLQHHIGNIIASYRESRVPEEEQRRDGG